MMTGEIFVFDTYALIELLENNSNYVPYSQKEIVINEFIFSEFCYQLIKNNVEDKNELLDEIKPAIKHLSPEIIQKAMEFRHKNKKKKLSMTDCISYFQAQDLGISFLTGDKEFEELDGVEFVK